MRHRDSMVPPLPELESQSDVGGYARAGWIAVVVALLLAFALRPIPWADSTGAVYGPISFLCEGDWDYDEFPFLYERQPLGEHIPWSGSAVRPDPDGERLLSFTGLGIKLLATPAALLLWPWSGESSEISVLRVNQLTVVLCCIAVLWLMLAALRSWTGSAPPTWLLPALFFGTVLWPQSRQTLWSNQASMLGIVTVLLVAVTMRDKRRAIGPGAGMLLGLGLGQATLSRPSALLLLLPILFALAWERRESLRSWLPALLLVALPFAAATLHDNLVHTGSTWTPPFAVVAADIARVHGTGEGALSGNPAIGLLGLLVSPSRGLLVFSPWLLALAPGIRRSASSHDPFRRALLIGVGCTLLVNASYTDWWGGDSWGPRRLQELLPALLLLGFPSRFDRDKRDRSTAPSTRVLMPLLAVSITVQALGFFVYDSKWDIEHSAIATSEAGAAHETIVVGDTEARMWSLRDGVLVDSLARLLRGELEFGWDNEISLATGWRYQPPLPNCATLREVDRFPRRESPQPQ